MGSHRLAWLRMTVRVCSTQFLTNLAKDLKATPEETPAFVDYVERIAARESAQAILPPKRK